MKGELCIIQVFLPVVIRSGIRLNVDVRMGFVDGPVILLLYWCHFRLRAHGRASLVFGLQLLLGSGTTLAAAELTERACCGMEFDPKYVDIIVQRWQTLSGEKAKLDGDGRTFEAIAEGRRQGAA